MLPLSIPKRALLLCVLASGCGPFEQKAPTVSSDRAEAVPLQTLPFAELQLPGDNRDGQEPSEQVPLEGPWHYAGRTAGGLYAWSTPVPIRPRSLYFFNPQPGMALTGPEGPLRYEVAGRGPRASWSYDSDRITIHLPEPGRPAPGAFRFSYPRAADRERSLNFDQSGVEEPSDFAWSSAFVDGESMRGLLLPAPGRAAWDVVVPPAAELTFRAGIVEPELIEGARSDGARLSLEIDTPGGVLPLWTGRLRAGRFDPVRIDLSEHAGTKVRLRVRSEPGGHARYDYVFLGQPVLASRSEDPQRVVLIYVDTLRPDHMSLYGHDRPTSPAVDAWAEGAVVFEQARSVAPWTLPSARSVVTGRQPEFYDVAQTLQGRIADRGWPTAMFAANMYLSANFDMDRDWGLHRVRLLESATVMTDDALAFLDAHEGRDLLMLVHYMDPHLPYTEPQRYRYLFAGSPTAELGETFHLNDVRRARVRDPETKEYIRGRYDNNVRYATDQVGRLLERLDENDIVIFFSDHGEEFWEHNGFEHGHTLYDELLRVPLILDGPGLDGRRVDAPVSLLDITPTVLDMLGMPHEGLDGTSLLPVARGDGSAAEVLRRRDLVFGRPLYGTERWGVLTGSHKWTTHEGREFLFDLATDPSELTNLVANRGVEASEAYHRHMADALGTPVGLGYRLSAAAVRQVPQQDLVAHVTVPGGVEHAVVAHDPLLKSSASVRVDGDVVTATWHAGFPGGRDIHIIPRLPVEEVTHQIAITWEYGESRGELTVDPRRDPRPGRHRAPLARQVVGGRPLALTWVVTPIFSEEAQGVVADDPEVTDMLEAMGYLTGGEATDDSDG